MYESGVFLRRSQVTSTMKAGAKPVQVEWGSPQNRELARNTVVFWSNWNTREVFPFPFTPLAWSHFVEMIGPGFLESLFGITKRAPLYRYSVIVDLVYGRLYWNMNLTYGHPLWGPLFRRLVPQLDEEAWRLFKGLYQKREFKPAEPPIGLVARWLVILKGFSTLLRSPWFLTVRRLEYRCDKYWKKSCEFENTRLDGKLGLELISRVREFTAYTVRFFAPLLLASFTAFLAFGVIRYLTRKWRDIDPGRLLAGIPGNKTTQGALELYRLSQVPEPLKRVFLNYKVGEIAPLLEKGKDGKVFLERLEQFMLLYGHRGSKEFDLRQPRWRDDPSFIFQMIGNYLQLHGTDDTPLEHFSQMAQERERLAQLVSRRLSQGTLARVLPWRKWLFRAMLRRAHAYLPYRENPKYYALKCYYGSRRIFLEIGRRLSAEGYLESPDGVWFLTLSELETLLRKKGSDREGLRRLIETRRGEWEANLSVDPPFIVRSDGQALSYPGPYDEDANTLGGTPASGGKATGKARVILDPAQGCAFNKGEILVAHHTDPGWTPLFLTAKALVMEVGGVVSHGAIVAREYGIPAVVGVKHATKLISTGDEITVDGNQGKVFL